MHTRKTLLAAAAVAVAAFSSSALAEKYTLRLAETWGPNSPILGETTKHFEDMVEKMSAGRIDVRIDSANKHKAPFGIFDMVRNGQYDMGHTASISTRASTPKALTSPPRPLGWLVPS